MVKVETFRQEHFTKIVPRKCHSTEFLHDGVTPNYPHHTFLVDDKPVAIFGGVFLHDKLFHCWAYFSDEIQKFPIEFTRKTKRLLEIFMEHHGVERLEIKVRSDYFIGQRFAAFLGFEFEGISRRYGRDGSDYHNFARIKWPLQSS